MRILKKIFFVILGIVAIILIIPIFLSKEYNVEKSITINKPKSEVFNYIKYLKNQNEYSKWASMDPAMKKTFTGTDASVGFISSWEGNDDVGKGEQEIVKITEGEKIDYELRFEKPMKDIANAYISTDSIGVNQTLVKWNINGHMNYPFNIMGLFMNKMMGGDLQTGLSNLKSKIDK
jgi:uncharacterized membrane protein